MILRITLAASLLAFRFFYASGGFAAGTQVNYQMTFSPDSSISGNIRIHLQNNSITPALILVHDFDGRRSPISFRVDQKEIYLGTLPISNNLNGITVLYRANSAKHSLAKSTVYSNDSILHGDWSEPTILTNGILTDVVDSLKIGIVAQPDTHTVAFTVTTNPISDSGAVWVIFPNGFNLVNVDNVLYYDNDYANDGNEPVISSIIADDHALIFQFASGGLQAQSDSRIWFEFWPVVNDTIAQNNTVLVFTTGPGGDIQNNPAESAPFNLQPDIFHHIAMAPDTATVVPSGSLLAITAAARDRYENTIDTISFIFEVTVDSCGEILDGAFQSAKLGQCFVTASAGGITDSTGEITITPGPLDRFYMLGYPSARIAGQNFPSGVTVAALDAANNRKYDYLGPLWFSTSDTIDDLPYEAANPYTYTIADSGLAVFSGNSFTLKRAGVRTISISNGLIGASSNPIRVTAASINSFVMATGLSPVAGEPFYVNVDSAIDLYGNNSSGEIIVSDSIGGGNSPDGIPPSLNHIIVSGGSGRAFQTVTNAVPTMLKGELSGGGAIGATPLFLVMPGTLGRYGLAGYPDIIVAGEVFPQNINLTVFDIFGNLKTDYDDWIYFTSTDTNAVLPYTQASPFHFLSIYSGIHSFAEPFSFRSSGGHYLAVTDGVIEGVSQVITVNPGVINQFSLSAPPNAVAGISFAVTASNVRDAWGNAANGTIAISDSIGGGPSPDGISPNYSPIQIVSGSGTANQILYNSVATFLKGVAGNVVVLTNGIDVAPGSAGSFDFVVSSPQVVGIPFYGEAAITAFDRFGNLKSNYNAAADTVVISAIDGGALTNNILRSSSDFVSGVANLVTRGTTYHGRGGAMIFQADSQSGIMAASNLVNMNGIRCASFGIEQSILSPGDTATGTISVNNLAGVEVDITDLYILDLTGWNSYPISNPALPSLLGPGESRTFSITLPIPSDLSAGSHPLTAAVRGRFSSYLVGDTLPGYPDTILIQSQSLPGYVEGSLGPDTLLSGGIYTMSLGLRNTGSAGLALMDTSHVSFSDGTRYFTANLASPIYLPPDDPTGILALFDSAFVSPDFTPGAYQAIFYYYGLENGLFQSGSVTISDSVQILRPAHLSYVQGSSNIDSLVTGQSAAFAIQIQNSGAADFIIRHQNTRISFGDSNREYISFSDTTTGIRVDVLHPGITVFHFASALLPADFISGDYLPSVIISGWQNGREDVVSFNTGADTVKVLSSAAIRIDSTYSMSLNAPFINLAQQCSIKVMIENSGDEGVNSANIRLSRNGISIFPDSIFIPQIGGHQIQVVYFVGNGGPTPNPNEIFSSSIFGGVGSISGNSARIEQPLDNIALLVIETPAELELSPISIISPPEALDDTISTGQAITISAIVRNRGQAGISSQRQLALDPGSVPWEIDSLRRDYNLDEPAIWTLVAPSSRQDSAVLRIRIAENPIDVNDGSPAVGPDSVSAIRFVVEPQPFISHNAAITAPPGALDRVISTDQEFIITDTLRAGGPLSTTGVRISLPDGISTQDSLVKYPEGNYASWRLRAPSQALVDTIVVQSWVIDANTGDSIGSAPSSLPISVVNGASLRISTRIVGPPSAVDGIVEPGGYLLFEAVVQNWGDASVGPGQMILRTGNAEMVPTDDPIQEFVVGIPITWTISLPSQEVSLPIPISASIIIVPTEENSGGPARVVIDSSWVSVLIRKLYPRLVLDNIAGHSGSIVRGQNLNYMSFELQNYNIAGNYPIGIAGFSFDLISNPPASASAIFSSASVVSDSGVIACQNLDSGTLIFNNADTIYLASSSQMTFTLSLEIRPDAAVRDFAVRIGENIVDASVIENGNPSQRLSAVSSRGEQPNWQNEPTAILEQSFTGSLSGYPNPFNPREGGIRIGYYLAAPANLQIKVFTLLGELVWTKSILATDEFGTAGLHTGQTALNWDGKNDIGREIRSGVYICMVRNLTTGEEEKFKIAILK